jgi:hypothetical protein
MQISPGNVQVWRLVRVEVASWFTSFEYWQVWCRRFVWNFNQPSKQARGRIFTKSCTNMPWQGCNKARYCTLLAVMKCRFRCTLLFARNPSASAKNQGHCRDLRRWRRRIENPRCKLAIYSEIQVLINLTLVLRCFCFVRSTTWPWSE